MPPSAVLRALIAAATLTLASLSPAALADTSEARRLLDEGRAAQALRSLDELLQVMPNDAEARFLRGLALSRLGRYDDAIDAFSGLTRDYPQLPEPYNNLAVIYAQRGDYERARDALESALATHPSYATAHENLGDIYAALASASYNRALALAGDNPPLRNKLRQMEQLGGGSAPITVSTTRRTEISGEGGASSDSTASAEPPVITDPSRPDAGLRRTEIPAPSVAAAPSAAPPPAAAEPAAAAGGRASPAEAERISNAIYQWSQAWQNQDVDAYLASYASDFSPAGGVSRAAWEAQRRDRVSSPGFIRVRVRDSEIQLVSEDRARVTFQQEYESDVFSDVTTKILDLKKVDGRWLILRETTG